MAALLVGVILVMAWFYLKTSSTMMKNLSDGYNNIETISTFINHIPSPSLRGFVQQQQQESESNDFLIHWKNITSSQNG